MLSAAGVTAEDKSANPRPEEKGYYVKVEIKGDLDSAPDFRFDPKIDVKGGRSTGAWVSTGQALIRFELLAGDKKHYDFVKANTGKKVFVTGRWFPVTPCWRSGFSSRSWPSRRPKPRTDLPPK